MDKALLELLEEKDFEYITVKEICKKANVNRSTFYLHYENIGDLLSECITYMNECFMSYFPHKKEDLTINLNNPDLDKLYLITPEYLIPYLNYIKDNKRIFTIAVKKPYILNSNQKFDSLFKHIFTPIMDIYNIPENEQKYVISFYINGIIAIIHEWLRNDCKEPIDFIVKIITDNIRKQ